VVRLYPGKNDLSFLGLGNDFIEWETPVSEIPNEIPMAGVTLDQYCDLVGMTYDPTSSGHDVVPRRVEPSKARLSALLDDGDANSQLLALSWIVKAQQTYSSLIDNVQRRLSSPISRVRVEAIEALSRPAAFPPARVAGALATVLADADVEVRVSALFALEKLGSSAASAVPQLREVLKMTDEYSERLGAHVDPRDFACLILANIGPAAAAAVPDLIRIIQTEITSPTNMRQPYSCVMALGEIGDARPDVIHELLGALIQDDINMRNAAAIALGRLPVSSIEILPALEAASNRAPDSVEIADTLAKVRSNTAH
jgi:HEAT repeat protein